MFPPSLLEKLRSLLDMLAHAGVFHPSMELLEEQEEQEEQEEEQEEQEEQEESPQQLAAWSGVKPVPGPGPGPSGLSASRYTHTGHTVGVEQRGLHERVIPEKCKDEIFKSNKCLLESSMRLKPHEAQSYRKKVLWVSCFSIVVTLILAVAAFSKRLNYSLTGMRPGRTAAESLTAFPFKLRGEGREVFSVYNLRSMMSVTDDTLGRGDASDVVKHEAAVQRLEPTNVKPVRAREKEMKRQRGGTRVQGFESTSSGQNRRPPEDRGGGK
ncbi:Transmembrane protein 163 [Liparis tanakae]|uniref:Transmembrane protein 163 n=1 Tax=Liparis tanakae TaxID=230148 RepID=A0A4Z2GE23_9TELE|nr:Transmembrane protein 163 [Liparis tanakae]